MLFKSEPLIPIRDPSDKVVKLKPVSLYAPTEIPEASPRRTQHFRVVEGAPNGVLEFENAFSLPPHLCLFDRDGRRILESCVRRGPMLSEIEQAPERVDIPADLVTMAEPVLYLSYLVNHWGHVLTESVSRVWARLKHPELAKLTGVFVLGYPVHKNIEALFRELDLELGSQAIVATKPTLYKKIFVPRASFSNRGEAYSAHSEIFGSLRARHAPSAQPEGSQQPVFLSRAPTAGGRNIRGVAALEQRLTERGVKVVRPEQMTLFEQIGLFNAHTHFVGCWGSAFHNTLFAANPAPCTTYVISDLYPNTNFFMFDAIVGNSAHYLCAMQTEGPDPSRPGLTDYTIDEDWIVDYWNQCGIGAG